MEDHARDILQLTRDQPEPRAVLCDHDAEDRATLERHLGRRTVGAKKALSPGIQAVKSRLRPAGDGKPRLCVFADALVDRDAALEEAKRPCGSVEEVDGYVWDAALGNGKEAPVKAHDHGMDCWRYLVAEVDGLGRRRLVMY